eukprot:scaffold529_cov308-Pinguiococcus_pyrenoidosus.AAC.64
MGCEEVSANVGNRLGRLCHYLHQQRSLYPLFPPPADGPGGSPSQLDFRTRRRSVEASAHREHTDKSYFAKARGGVGSAPDPRHPDCSHQTGVLREGDQWLPLHQSRSAREGRYGRHLCDGQRAPSLEGHTR